MQAMIEQLIGLTLIAFALERAVEYVFSMYPFCFINAKYASIRFKSLTAFLMGFGIAYFAKIDVVGILLSKPELSGIAGYAFTGLLLAGGSNVFSDIMTMIQNLKNPPMKTTTIEPTDSGGATSTVATTVESINK